MRIIICGGGLQGVELCFLAKQAGWHSILLDKAEATPASALADYVIIQNLCYLDTASKAIRECFFGADLVIPATENLQALQALTAFCQKHEIPCAFDMQAYSITASKLRSRELFLQCNTPIPTPFGEKDTPCFPIIAKPSCGSGSQGVQIFHNAPSFEDVFPLGTATPEWIFEAYCEGSSYSIEICGTPDKYTCFTVTALDMDTHFDCAVVTTPSGLNAQDEKFLEVEAIRLATALQLRGIMDLEVIRTPKGYVVLEIDARFPSQTPTAVYLASGINLIEQLAACYISYTPRQQAHASRHVWYGHIQHKGIHCQQQGEHIMTEYGPLQLQNLYPSYEALVGKTDTSWVATLMLHETSSECLQKLRERCLQDFTHTFPLASTV